MASEVEFWRQDPATKAEGIAQASNDYHAEPVRRVSR
jgi:hypothetical protein